MEKINENLIQLNKNQFLKRNKRDEWNIIAPLKDPITKKINLFNLITGGSVVNLIKVIIIVSLIAFISYGYAKDKESCFEMLEDPFNACMKAGYYKLNLGEEIKEDEEESNRPSLFMPTEVDVKQIS